MKKLLISSIVAIAIVISFANVNVFAQSSKAAIGNTYLVEVPDASTSTIDATASSADAPDGWHPIMTANIKTANDKGFAFDISLQSAIFTQTEVRSKGGNKSVATASGRVKVRVAVYAPGDVDPTYAQPSSDLVDDVYTNSGEGVTYNYREQILAAEFQGICIDYSGEFPVLMETCEDETVSLVLDTLEANSFNFYYGLTDSGVYHDVVEAKCETEATVGEGEGDAKARAYVGLGSMFVENVRLVKGSGWTTPTIELK